MYSPVLLPNRDRTWDDGLGDSCPPLGTDNSTIGHNWMV
jgi:hypothetical protein